MMTRRTLKGFHDGKPIYKYHRKVRLVDKGTHTTTEEIDEETAKKPGPGWTDLANRIRKAAESQGVSTNPSTARLSIAVGNYNNSSTSTSTKVGTSDFVICARIFEKTGKVVFDD